MNESLRRLPLRLQAGIVYRIRVEYSNTIYTASASNPDIDGVTLYAYQDSATPNPQPTPTISPPSSTVSLRADRITSTSAHLFWTPYRGTNLQSYRLFRGTTSNFTPSGTNAVTAEATDLEFSDSGLQPATVYTYLLRLRFTDGTATDVRHTFSTRDAALPSVTFANTPRLCAGHVLDSLHMATISGHATQPVAGGGVQALANAELTLEFFDNIPPPPTSTPPLPLTQPVPKPAAFAVQNTDGTWTETPTLTVNTDQNGDFSFIVVSSSIVTNQISVRVNWKNANNNLQNIGDVGLDCAPVETRTEFNLNNTGWSFTPALFSLPNQRIVARVRLMFCTNTSQRGNAASWSPVAGHQVRVSITNLHNDENNPNGGAPLANPPLSPAIVSFTDANGYYIDEKGEIIRVRGSVYVPLAPGGIIDPHTGQPMVPVRDTDSFAVPSSVPVTTDAQGWATVYLQSGPEMPQMTGFNLRVVEMTQRR